MAIGDLFGSLGIKSGTFLGGGLVSLFIQMVLGIIILGSIAGFFIWLYKRKKKWFIHVNVKLPRGLKYLDPKSNLGIIDSNNIHLTGIINAETAKGAYDTKLGTVLIKRYKKKAVAMKPFDIKRYLQGNNILDVVQVGVEDYRPILPESYIEMVDDKTGEETALMQIKIDTSESKSWREIYERTRKSTYSIMSLLQTYAPFIGFGILFFMIFIGFAILYGRIK